MGVSEMKIFLLLFVIAASLLLSGCATFSGGTYVYASSNFFDTTPLVEASRKKQCWKGTQYGGTEIHTSKSTDRWGDPVIHSFAETECQTGK